MEWRARLPFGAAPLSPAVCRQDAGFIAKITAKALFLQAWSNRQRPKRPQIQTLAGCQPGWQTRNKLIWCRKHIQEVLLTLKDFNLTPKEVQICNMIKRGLSSKEIAAFLGISIFTVGRHRHNIRKKIKITNKKDNLNTFLHGLWQLYHRQLNLLSIFGDIAAQVWFWESRL